MRVILLRRQMLNGSACAPFGIGHQRKRPNYRRWRSQSKNFCVEKQFDPMVKINFTTWYAADFPFTNEKFFCAESAGRLWDSKKGLAQNLDLVPEAEDAKFDELVERYLSTGFLFCEEVKFVNYMAKFFTYRYCSIAKLRYWDYEENDNGDERSSGTCVCHKQALCEAFSSKPFLLLYLTLRRWRRCQRIQLVDVPFPSSQRNHLRRPNYPSCCPT